jgi:signal transduction histidine kinase
MVNTLGARLTLLYLLAAAVTAVAVFLLGRLLIAHQVRDNLDALLAARFTEVGERYLADPDAGARDLPALVSPQGASLPFQVVVESRWRDPTFSQARSRGVTPPDAAARQYCDGAGAGGEPVRVLEGNYQSLHIRISAPLASVQAALRTYTRVGLSLVVLAVAAGAVAAWFLSRTALRPVRLIERTAARISSDNLSERIPVAAGGRDEIARLSDILNRTFDRLQASFEQIQRFSEDASHEMKTPLALIRLNVERLVEREPLSPPGQEALQDALAEIHRLDRLIERLLFLARAQAGDVGLSRMEQDPRDFIRGFSHDGQALSEASRIRFTVGANEECRANFDAGRMRQVLFNLLSNALYATPAGGEVTLRSQFLGGDWTVSVEDEGPGLPPEKCAVIFERFVRIPRAGGSAAPSGAGLGLAICRSIVTLHGGSIRAEPRGNRPGLRVTFSIPGRAAQS